MNLIVELDEHERVSRVIEMYDGIILEDKVNLETKEVVITFYCTVMEQKAILWYLRYFNIQFKRV